MRQVSQTFPLVHTQNVTLWQRSQCFQNHGGKKIVKL